MADSPFSPDLDEDEVIVGVTSKRDAVAHTGPDTCT
jgi:hypothetical protein